MGLNEIIRTSSSSSSPQQQNSNHRSEARPTTIRKHGQQQQQQSSPLLIGGNQQRHQQQQHQQQRGNNDDYANGGPNRLLMMFEPPYDNFPPPPHPPLPRPPPPPPPATSSTTTPLNTDNKNVIPTTDWKHGRLYERKAYAVLPPPTTTCHSSPSPSSTPHQSTISRHQSPTNQQQQQQQHRSGAASKSNPHNRIQQEHQEQQHKYHIPRPHPPLPEKDDPPILPHSVIDPNTGKSYKFGKVLGKGGFAHCYEGFDAECTEWIAIKVIPKHRLTKSNHYQKVKREIRLHRSVSHRNIVKLYSSFEDERNIYILLELCSLPLVQIVKNRQFLSELEVAYYIREIVYALVYLHDPKVAILHRDVKLGNVLVTKDMNVKLADFGLATDVDCRTLRPSMLSVCGTPNYISPEILSKQGHSVQSEMWALGCTMYAMLFGRPPFETSSLDETYSRISKGQYLLPETVSPAARDLVARLLDSNPKKRITPNGVLKHGFFSGQNGYAIPNRLFPDLAVRPPYSQEMHALCNEAALYPRQHSNRDSIVIANNQIQPQTVHSYNNHSSCHNDRNNNDNNNSNELPSSNSTVPIHHLDGYVTSKKKIEESQAAYTDVVDGQHRKGQSPPTQPLLSPKYQLYHQELSPSCPQNDQPLNEQKPQQPISMYHSSPTIAQFETANNTEAKQAFNVDPEQQVEFLRRPPAPVQRQPTSSVAPESGETNNKHDFNQPATGRFGRPCTKIREQNYGSHQTNARLATSFAAQCQLNNGDGSRQNLYAGGGSQIQLNQQIAQQYQQSPPANRNRKESRRRGALGEDQSMMKSPSAYSSATATTTATAVTAVKDRNEPSLHKTVASAMLGLCTANEITGSAPGLAVSSPSGSQNGRHATNKPSSSSSSSSSTTPSTAASSRMGSMKPTQGTDSQGETVIQLPPTPSPTPNPNPNCHLSRRSQSMSKLNNHGGSSNQGGHSNFKKFPKVMKLMANGYQQHAPNPHIPISSGATATSSSYVVNEQQPSTTNMSFNPSNHSSTPSSDRSSPTGKTSSLGVLQYLSSIQQILTFASSRNPEKNSQIQFEEYKRPESELRWVSNWIDYTNRYGFGVMLSDGAYTISFLDGSKLSITSTGDEMQYIDNVQVDNICPFGRFHQYQQHLHSSSASPSTNGGDSGLGHSEEYLPQNHQDPSTTTTRRNSNTPRQTTPDRAPTALADKIEAAGIFKSYIKENILNPNDIINKQMFTDNNNYNNGNCYGEEKENGLQQNHVPYLVHWKRIDSQAVLMLLSNGIFQINFIRDHVKLVVSFGRQKEDSECSSCVNCIYFDQRRQKHTFTLSYAHRQNNKESPYAVADRPDGDGTNGVNLNDGNNNMPTAVSSMMKRHLKQVSFCLAQHITAENEARHSATADPLSPNIDNNDTNFLPYQQGVTDC